MPLPKRRGSKQSIKTDKPSIPFFLFFSVIYKMDAVSKRLIKELREIDREAKAHPEIIELAPENDEDLLQWRAILAGLADTPYEGNKITDNTYTYINIV